MPDLAQLVATFQQDSNDLNAKAQAKLEAAAALGQASVNFANTVGAYANNQAQAVDVLNAAADLNAATAADASATAVFNQSRQTYVNDLLQLQLAIVQQFPPGSGGGATARTA